MHRCLDDALTATLKVTVIAVALLAGCGQQAPKAERPPPNVSVLAVKPQTVPDVPSFVAQTESSRRVDIMARVSGFLDQIAYREGELVQQGQLLFQIDPKPFRAQLAAALGEMKAQQARHSTATANINRVRPLVQQNALPQADLDRAQGEFDASRAAVYSAQAKVTEAKLNLGYTSIGSPVTGLASRSQQRQGAYINSASSDSRLTYVASIDPMWVNFSVSQNQLAKMEELIKSGQLVPPPNRDFDVELIKADGSSYAHRGKINFADPSFSQETGSFIVRAEVSNPDHELRPGMFVTARLHGAMRPNAVIVPQLSVQQGSNGHLVYVVKEDNSAELRPVVVGDYIEEKNIVIASGLHAGDRVVVEGALKVIPGQPVKVVEPAVAGVEAPATAASGGTKGRGADKTH